MTSASCQAPCSPLGWETPWKGEESLPPPSPAGPGQWVGLSCPGLPHSGLAGSPQCQPATSLSSRGWSPRPTGLAAGLWRARPCPHILSRASVPPALRTVLLACCPLRTPPLCYRRTLHLWTPGSLLSPAQGSAHLPTPGPGSLAFMPREPPAQALQVHLPGAGLLRHRKAS